MHWLPDWISDVDLADIAPLFAAVSALAAAVAARSSRLAVTRSHAPFVWPSIAIQAQNDHRQHAILVRLHNDGPGVAFNVRFALRGRDEDYGLVWATPPVRAMRGGEQVPPLPEPQEVPISRGMYEYGLPGRLGDGPWWVVVRYADGLGRRWELRAPLDPHARLLGPRRLRGGRLERWRSRETW